MLNTQLAQTGKFFTSKNGLRDARNLSSRQPISSQNEIPHRF